MGPQSLESGIELNAIAGEIEQVLTGRGEDGHTIRGFESVDAARGAVAHPCEVREIEMDVVKKVGDEALGRNGRLIPWLRSAASGLCRLTTGFLHRKLRDLLPLAFVEELEILFGQVPDGVSLRIAHYHWDHH